MAEWPFSIRLEARRPRMPRLLRRCELPPFLRKSLLRLMTGVSLKGRAIFCESAWLRCGEGGSRSMGSGVPGLSDG